MSLEFINTLWAVLSIGAILLSVFLIISLFVKSFREIFSSQFNFLGKNGVLFGGIIALLATIGSLFYSNYFGYAPCELCWIQRIAMYPLAFMLIAAYFRKEGGINFYGVVLAVFGAIVALYNHALQMGFNPLNLSCGSAIDLPGVVSCSKVYVLEFGFMTMPLMSFSVLILIAILLVANNKSNTWTD